MPLQSSLAIAAGTVVVYSLPFFEGSNMTLRAGSSGPVFAVNCLQSYLDKSAFSNGIASMKVFSGNFNRARLLRLFEYQILFAAGSCIMIAVPTFQISTTP